jgi:hypothetical protein
LHWSEEAVALAHGVSGGHALLVRELASIVLQNQRHSRSNTVQIRPGIVHQAIPRWRTDVASHVRDVLPHLRRYYTDEADLAIMLMDDQGAFADFATSYSDSVGRLVDLGIVSATPDGTWKPTPLLQFSHEFEKRPDADRTYAGKAILQLSVEELVAADESETLERKEAVRAHGGAIPDEVIVDQVLKACLGFLNRRGGHVLVGVSDDGTVVGIDRDIKVCGSVDKLIQFLTDKVRTKIGNSGIDLISVTTPRCGESMVMILEVPAPEPVCPAKPVDGKDGLFVRNNNTTNVLVGKEALDDVRRRWNK